MLAGATRDRQVIGLNDYAMAGVTTIRLITAPLPRPIADTISVVDPTSPSDLADLPIRRIAHLDMDAFYASVELLRYPELKGHAVVIGGGRQAIPIERADGRREFARLRDYAGRGVVTTSTYEARALGVFSAMGMMKAAQLTPDAFLLPTDFDAYRHDSRLFKAAVRTFTDRVEDRGIDEIVCGIWPRFCILEKKLFLTRSYRVGLQGGMYSFLFATLDWRTVYLLSPMWSAWSQL